MTPPRERKSGPAQAPKIQDRPAAPAAPKAPVLDPDNRDGEFLPNPAPVPREGRPKAEERDLRVTGPKEVGGVVAPGRVSITLTEAQLDALISGGHVEPWTDDQGDAPEKEGN